MHCVLVYFIQKAAPMTILTFASDAHHAHAPQTEFLHGKHVPFFEKPQRIDNLRAALTAANLIHLHQPETLVSKDELAKTHSRGMLDHFEHLSTNLLDVLRTDFGIYRMQDEVTEDQYYYESVFPPRSSKGDDDRRGFYIFDSTSPIGAETWEAILHSATLAYAGAKALLDGERRAYALCRPPGHHAGYDFAGGYCYVNNAAVAANVLKARGKVAILDIDYHHGNGTQQLFWNDPDVLFVSLHADPAVDYPYYSGFAGESGGSDAPGSNINVPLPHGTTTTTYVSALNTALERITAYGVDALVISLGWDTYKDDPMAKFELAVDDYGQLGAMIDAVGLPTLYVQEGGYAVEMLGAMAVRFFRGVLAGV